MRRFFVTGVLFGMLLTAQLCLSDEDSKESDEDGDDKKKLDIGALFVEPMKGVGDWIKNAADEVKERSESGIETMKEFSSQAKEKSDTGVGAMKGFAEGIGERFSKAKEKLGEHGEKMKEALGSAAEKSKDEFDTAASQISKHAKDASELVFSMFGG